jgi:hypothetical protein
LALYRDVQARLTAAGFPAHAAEFDERIAHLLVATGSESDAIALVMERLWVAERADDSLSAQVAARTLKSLAGLPEFGPARPEDGSSPLLVAAAQVAEFVADNLHQPVPTTLDLPTGQLQYLSAGDRAQTVLFAAERALSDDDFDWFKRYYARPRCGTETTSRPIKRGRRRAWRTVTRTRPNGSTANDSS